MKWSTKTLTPIVCPGPVNAPVTTARASIRQPENGARCSADNRRDMSSSLGFCRGHETNTVDFSQHCEPTAMLHPMSGEARGANSMFLGDSAEAVFGNGVEGRCV